jgi:SagB-type dehydrogenase family enzyme
VKRRDMLTGLAVAVLAGGCATQAPPWVRKSNVRYSKQVALPAPATGGLMSLELVIERRRSERSFRRDPLPIATIGQLLWAGQGITSPDGKRTAPSAGALYPLELYVVTPTEVMHYLPQGHRVEVRAGPDLRPELQAAAFGQPPVGAAPDLIVVAAVPDRTRVRYGARAEAFVDREAGHAAQNILLQATARGLAAVPIGSLDPSRAATALALPADHTVLYLIPVGLARDPRP